MSNAQAGSIQRDLKQDDLILVTGAGGFIGGSLVRYFHDLGYTRIRAVDKKPLSNWYQRVPGVESLHLDLSEREACVRAVENAVEVYNLAADMGGMGFIERFRVECMRSSLINTHMVEAAYQAGVDRYFFSSSACVYNTLLQQDPNVRALKERWWTANASRSAARAGWITSSAPASSSGSSRAGTGCRCSWPTDGSSCSISCDAATVRAIHARAGRWSIGRDVLGWWRD